MGRPLPEDPRRGLPAPVPVALAPTAWRTQRARPPRKPRMKLCQFQLPRLGARLGVLDGDTVIDVTSPRVGVTSVLDLLVQGRSPLGIERLARRLAGEPRRPRHAWASIDRAPRHG